MSMWLSFLCLFERMQWF